MYIGKANKSNYLQPNSPTRFFFCICYGSKASFKSWIFFFKRYFCKIMQWGVWCNMLYYTFQRTWHIMALSHLQPPKITRGQTLHASTLWRAFPSPGRRPTTQPEREKPQSCMNSSLGQHLPTTRSSFWIFFRYSLLSLLMFIKFIFDCFRYV